MSPAERDAKIDAWNRRQDEKAQREADKAAAMRPPAGHVQMPGTYWTPSDPQQIIAGGVAHQDAIARTAERMARYAAERAERAAQPEPAPMLTKGNRGIHHTQTEGLF